MSLSEVSQGVTQLYTRFHPIQQGQRQNNTREEASRVFY